MRLIVQTDVPYVGNSGRNVSTHSQEPHCDTEEHTVRSRSVCTGVSTCMNRWMLRWCRRDQSYFQADIHYSIVHNLYRIS